jgi:predicted Zn-dependent protease
LVLIIARMSRASITILFLLIALSGFAQDVSIDKKIGAQNAAMVEQEMGLYHHDSLYHLVNAVGHKLVSRLKTNPFEFQFFIADSPEPNAFALPGGYVYVTRGILILLQSEDELAGIMAHEIIHVTQRHSVKQAKKGVLTSLLEVPGNLLNAVTGTQIGNLINAPINLTTKAFISKYSRGHESESDEFGIQLAASAGYKPEALANALDRLSRQVALLTGDAEQRSYFSDHPYTPGRVSAIRKSAPLYKPVNPSPISKNATVFLQKFNGLCFGENPQQGVFIDTLFVQSDLRFAWLTPSGWPVMNKPSMVATHSKKGDAIAALKIADSKSDPKDLAEKIKKEAQKNQGLEVLSAIDTTINSYPAYLLRLKSSDKNQVVITELIWLRYNGMIFQLAGISTPELHKKMHKALCGFRAAKPEELLLVKLYELNVVKAQSNESLENISQRTGNKLKPDFTSLINEYDASKPFSNGALVKVVTSKPYHPKR